MPTHDYPYKNLVFEGGGVKDVAYGGVFEVLEQRQITPQIESVAGTSAEARGAAVSIKPGVKRSCNPRNRPLKNIWSPRQRPIAVRLQTSIVMIPLPAAPRAMNKFRRQFLGFRFAPPQGGVPGRAARLGCETLCHRPLRGL